MTRDIRWFLPILWLSLMPAPASSAGAPAPVAVARSAQAQARRELAEILRLTPDPGAGKALFDRCATCHGTVYPELPRGWVPRIAGQHSHVIAKQLIDYRHGLRQDLRMEVVARQHLLGSGQDIANLAAYAAREPWPATQAGDPVQIAAGKARYQRRCAACHGAAGAGSNAHLIPRLAGQDQDYLLRQMHDVLEGRRAGLTVPHARLLKPLDVQALGQLAAYLASANPDARAATPSLTAQR